MKKIVQKQIMYYEVKKLAASGLSISAISSKLELNWRTVKLYLKFTESEFQQYLDNQRERKKELDSYEPFIKEKLTLYSDTSAAQMHDWLKEHYPDFPGVSPKTVFNYVSYVRQKYNLSKSKPVRDYFPVEELPFGKQAQVDFGSYNMRTTEGKRAKVYFFALVLSRSRYKYVCFSRQPFTSVKAAEAHEKAFAYIQGVPKFIVYDQDRVFLVQENMGDLLLTQEFKKYASERKVGLHFCRKEDPESKGKVENVVKYVKRNFLYNRSFISINLLNIQALQWLERTANAMPHNVTQIPPRKLWEKEVEHLTPYWPVIPPEVPTTAYTVRKDNTIAYKGNYYTLPQGTYKDGKSKVYLSIEEEEIVLKTAEGSEICRHQIYTGRGKIIRNTDHKRDKSLKVKELKTRVLELFTDKENAEVFLTNLQKAYPRYVRDHYELLLKEIPSISASDIDMALETTVKGSLYNARDFLALCNKTEETTELKVIYRNLRVGLDLNTLTPDKSSINTYQTIINNGQNNTN